jgi:hypothetical protein
VTYLILEYYHEIFLVLEIILVALETQCYFTLVSLLHAYDMILNIHSDDSYLSEREAKIRSGGLFDMGSRNNTEKKLTNGAILIISTVLKHLMSSAAEAEIGAVL